jgi:hypothetical protein
MAVTTSRTDIEIYVFQPRACCINTDPANTSTCEIKLKILCFGNKQQWKRRYVVVIQLLYNRAQNHKTEIGD